MRTTIVLEPAILPPARGYTMGESVLAESSAYARLRVDLERYARDALPGASYLVSGHRGSGKTTAVHQAIANARADFENLKEPRRLLLVRLNGPDFLRHVTEHQGDPDAVAPVPPAPDGATCAQVPPPPAGPLIQVTTALYRALADEIAHGFWRRAQEGGDPELAARVRIELDGGPPPDVLAEAWRRAGVVPSAEAFRKLVEANRQDAREASLGVVEEPVRRGVLFAADNETLPADQAQRELVAVATAAQAYQRATGAVESKTSQESAHTRAHESGAATPEPGSSGLDKLVQAAFGLAAGGGAGLAVAQGQGSAAVAGLVTALLGVTGFRWVSSRKLTRSRSTSVHFVPNTAPETLARVLPDLVRRLQEAGLYPVFVVDELDKIDHLGKNMESLVRRLKQFVTEQSFFCFLTDRDYFAGLEDDSFKMAYPRSHTFFTNRAFVAYTTGQLHDYLKRLFGVLGDSIEEAPETAALRFVLLLRARSHAFDLRHELERMREGASGVVLPGEFLDRPRTHAELAMQLALERRLRDPLMQRFCSDPRNLQLAYDALYHPARMWRLGDAELDISLDAFARAMDQRVTTKGSDDTDTDTEPRAGGTTPGGADPTGGAKAGPGAPVPPAGDTPPTTTTLDAPGAPGPAQDPPQSQAGERRETPHAVPNQRRLEVLHAQLEQMVAELCDLPGLARVLLADSEALGDDVVPEKVVRVLAASRVKLLESAGEGRYTWLCDDLGQQHEVQIPTEIGALTSALAVIADMEEVVRGLAGRGLSMEGLNELPSMPPTPTWPETAEARQRVRANAAAADARPLGERDDSEIRTIAPYDQHDGDLDLIGRYAALLQDNSTMLGLYLGLLSLDVPGPDANGGDEPLPGGGRR